jgi:hypothetical protein
VFRRRSAGAPDSTAQDPPGAPETLAENPRTRPAAGPATPAARPAAQAGKGRPTPKRRESEAGRYQPIGGGSRRPAGPRTPADKDRDRAERSRKYDAMKRGEEWALNPRDRGQVRALARDYVDAKRRVSEYYMYVLILLLVAIFIRDKTVQNYVSPLILVLIVALAIEGFFIRRGLRKLVAERCPGQSANGLTMYAVMRALQIRRFRMPAPRLRPGDKF